MLKLQEIKKTYSVAGEEVHALKGVSVNFRKSEFVSILGPSGCGKTTLLNIIGGLDKYTSGDLIIGGKSTKEYGSRDWDTYRNHSIGFIFQSYHLIPHQSILQNVELALMIAGVSKKERRQRAIEALEKVGLADKIKNRPNQLSGGQAQRVAIARALINDPEIVLADEPTGALDSVTSVQIMELLKEISKDRLVVMVTHNPELAEQYSTRIVKLKDGEVTDDSMPYSDEEEAAEREATKPQEQATPEEQTEAAPEVKTTNKGKKKQSAMSMGMAMGLSCKNLLSKRKRTAMVSVAGSIGIIGVSMVLAISAGVRGYIDNMENDMLSGYPLSITQSSYDFTALMDLAQNDTKVDLAKLAKEKKVYVKSLLDTLGTFAKGFEKTNNITEAYLAYIDQMPDNYTKVIHYDYGINTVNNIYTDFKVSGDLKAHFADEIVPDKNEYNMSVAAIRNAYSSVLSHVEEYSSWGKMVSSVDTFKPMIDDFDYVMSQYDIVALDKDGRAVTGGYTEEEARALFNSKETMFMVVEDYKMNDLTLAQYGYMTQDEFLNYAYMGVNPEKKLELVGDNGISYDKFVGDGAKKFVWYPNDCVYNQTHMTMNTIPDMMLKPMIVQQVGSMAAYLGFDSGEQLADKIIEARSTGDTLSEKNANLKKFLTKNHMAAYYDYCRLYEAPEVIDVYTANAYADGYKVVTIQNGMPVEITQPAFSTKPSYDKRVNLGVNMILQKKSSVAYGCLEMGFYYSGAFVNHVLETEATSQIVTSINENKLKSTPTMYIDYYYVDSEGDSGHTVTNKEGASIKVDAYEFIPGESCEIETGGSIISGLLSGLTGEGSSTGLNANMFGGSKLPVGMYFYCSDFTMKNKVCDYLDAWNKHTKAGDVVIFKDGAVTIVKDFDPQVELAGQVDEWQAACDAGKAYTSPDGTYYKLLQENDKITYADTVGMIISMINAMIQIITIALIAFTALSLVVSTVMIGIITYVSVVERVKEIGILRAVGARKKDIKRLFNAETLVIGLIAGVFGIVVTYLLSWMINLIVLKYAGIWGIAALPWWQAVIMVGLSVFLTLVSGLIPASAAAKKDPVVALRTE